MKTITYFLVPCAAASFLGAAAWWGLLRHEAMPLTHTATAPLTAAPLVPTSAEPTPEPIPSVGRDFNPNRLLSEIASTTDPAVLELVAAIYNAPDAASKAAAADALASHGGYEAIANLLRLAGLETEISQRALILEALNAVSDPVGFTTMATALAATRDPQFIDAVISQLARTSEPTVLDTLVEMYRERNDAPAQKNQVLQAIASLRHPDLARPLRKLAEQATEPALANAADTAWQQLQTGTDHVSEAL